MSDLVEEIQTKRFTGTRFRAGYAMSDVDEFLDRAVEAVRRGDDLTALVDGAMFQTSKFEEGYDMEEVDDFLDRIKAGRTSSGREPTTATTATTATRVPEPTLPTGTGGLRRWLFGRR